MDIEDLSTNLGSIKRLIADKGYENVSINVSFQNGATILAWLSFDNPLNDKHAHKGFYDDSLLVNIDDMLSYANDIPDLRETAEGFVKQALIDLAEKAGALGCAAPFINSLRESAERLSTNIIEGPKEPNNEIPF